MANRKSDGAAEEEAAGVCLWNRETVPKAMKIVCTYVKLPQRDLIALLLVSPWLRSNLTSHPSLWVALDFHEMNNSGDRLVAALSLPRYLHLKHLILEFSQDIEDKHFLTVKNKCAVALSNLESLNLNGCQKISDEGVGAITSVSPKLMAFSIYWNVRVTDVGINYLVKNCKLVTELNLSGCKNITDHSMWLISQNFLDLVELNITRCVKITDGGLQNILLKCSIKGLNMYALSSLTDEAYKKISLLTHLKHLDLCGAQNLSDDGVCQIAKCKKIVSLNLTWCVRVTDVGVIAIAQSCTSLEFLSLFGIVGVTDKCVEVLSTHCEKTLTTLDVNGCIGIKRRTREELLQLFTNLICFKVHS